MTLLFMDGFDDGLTAQKWEYLRPETALNPAGRNGNAYDLKYNTGSFVFSGQKNFAANGVIIIGFAAYFTGSSILEVIFLPDSAGSRQLTFNRASNGWEVRRGNSIGAVVASGGSVPTNEWHYIEIKVVIHDTTGSVEIRKDGVTDLLATGIDTKNTSITDVASIGFYGSSSSYLRIDDMYICDDNGTVNNDFLGDCVVETLLPTGAGANNGFLGSDADSVDNHLLVDEATPDLVDYVESSVAGTKDSYAFADLSAGVTAVHGVQLAAYVSKPVAGAAQLRALTRQGGTDHASAALVTPSSAGIAKHLWELNPADSATWEKADVDGAEFGVEVA